MQNSDDIRLWRDTSLPGSLEMLRATCRSHRYPAHHHDEFVVAAFMSGAQRHRISRRMGIAYAGAVMLIPPGEVHTGEAAEAGGVWQYCAFYPTPGTLNDIAQDVLGAGDLTFGADPVVQDGDMAERLIRAHRVAEGARDALERQTAVIDALATLIRRYGQTSGTRVSQRSPDPDISKAFDYIHACYPHKLTVGDIAQVAGLSEYHFMRSFRSRTGLTIHGYVTQVRLRAAKDMLARGVSPAEAALSVGFFDQSHFTNTFRTHFGVTPKRYARACC